jgi:hypothetical protein
LPIAWYPYDAILISYHLFLVFLVITAEQKTGFSLPIVHTILSHLACLALVISVPVLRHQIPFFGLVRYFIPALAPFECDWLFSGGKAKKEEPITVKAAEAAATTASASASATADDYEEWLRYLKVRNPLSVKHGMTIKDEYEQWMVARVKSRPPAASVEVVAADAAPSGEGVA